MKKTFLIIAAMLCCIMLNAQQPTGDGTQANTYQIATADNLVWFANHVNSGNTSACAILTADIVVNSGVLNEDGTLNGSPQNIWTPIGGQNGRDYSGEFNGNGHTISGLYFNDGAKNNVGLFGKAVGSAYIHDLGVRDSYFYGKDHVGGICGDFASGRIENCWNGATVYAKDWNAGGISGSCYINASIKDCYNIGTIIPCNNNNPSYGGICGAVYENTNVDYTISNCHTLEGKCDKGVYGSLDNGCPASKINDSFVKDAAAFASGEVCYLLNHGVTNSSQKWYQTLGGTDNFPVLNSGHGTVYYGYDGDVLKYSNSPLTPPSIDNVAYIDANGQPQTAGNVSIIGNASEQVTWNAGWYVVQGADITLAKGAVCNGEVHLILANGAKLTATGDDTGYTPGIQVSGEGNSLTIYGQSAQSGQLIANGGDSGAGIGGGGGQRSSGSNITINGGIVTANGGRFAAGIGGGWRGSGSNITINGGTVTAKGGDDGAGIGGGMNGSGYNITIHDGTVTANGGQFGAGIGGGQNGNGSNIIINDGTVTANGGQLGGAGIGGGEEGYGSNITINGGTITANGVDGGAGIGGGMSKNGVGQKGDGFNITINGGKVTANGAGLNASGIGAGMEGSGSNIIIAATLLVKADDNNPPMTVIPNTGADLAGSLNGKQYVTTEPIIITYGEYITVSPEFESGANVAYGTYTFTAADRSADNFEFLGFYKESTFNTPITEGVSGYVYTLTVNEAVMSVYAKYRQHFSVPYIDADGQERTADAIEIADNTLNAGWYVVRGSDENHGALTCNGEVHLILADDANLTATGSGTEYTSPGIHVSGEGNSLTIYGQTAQSGQLKATGGHNAAGIGGGYGGSGSNITINGGAVTATGGECGAGIGGGNNGSGSNITINGGIVTAKGGAWAAGIGGGEVAHGSNIGEIAHGSNITINGGTVTAGGGYNGAGIGGGYGGSGSNITINGGTVTANGGQDASCIGRGFLCGGNYGSNIFVATGFIIRADGNNPPVTVVAADRTAEDDIANELDGKHYATVRIPSGVVTYGEYITVSPEFASGDRVDAETEVTFTAADRSADNYEFIGFYKESTFENKITQGVSGRTYTVMVLDDDISVYAKYKEFIQTSYLDADGQEQSVKAAEITNETSTLNAGWCVVTGTDVRTGTLTCNGAVNLILADGAKLTATGGESQAGITVSGEGNSLTIYGQTAQSGQLIAKGGKHGAGIGGGYASGSNITVNGGIIAATGGDCGTGIGGGDRGAGYNIIINRGVVTATGGGSAAGIGGGFEQSGYDITINGGTVTANGGKDGAGIGGGVRKDGYDITINDGEVTATGGTDAAGIGGGNQGSGSNITINGGTVTANGGVSAAGIGGGFEESGYDITINGGEVTANGGKDGAGIGGGVRKDGYNITINDGEVTATGGDCGTGIGGGNQGSGSNITIDGGTVTANGGSSAAGIGGGNQGSGSNITINGDEVTANGGQNAAGIGGGFEESGYDITINGGEVTATGGEDGAGIGGGAEGSGSNIKMATALTVYADNTNPPTTEISHTDNDIASHTALRYVIVKDVATGAKEAAIAAINAAIEGVTNADIIAIATNAIDAINAATSLETINAIKEQALAAIASAKAIYNSGLGEMGEPCEDCPSVEVTGQNDNMIRLYNPKKVTFRKE